jgi:hypothetical protein
MATLEKNLGDTQLEYAEDLEKTNTTWDDRPTLDPELDRRITRKFDTHGKHTLRPPLVDILILLLQWFPGYSVYGF